MTGELTVLCENTVTKPSGLIGEHGFAVLLETSEGAYLFDTGQGQSLLHNARLLGKDLRNLKGLILSHGHLDHCGGLARLLSHTGPLTIYAHPGIFTERYWVGRYEERANGLGSRREELEKEGARFFEVTDFRELVPGFFLSGAIPRHFEWETGDPNLMQRNPESGKLVPDPFSDDLSLGILTPLGLVVVLGCAHAGLMNILRHLQLLTGEKHIHAVIGGTHLAPASDEQFAATVEHLRPLAIDRLALSHCTGLPRGAELANLFPGRVAFANVGWTLTF